MKNQIIIDKTKIIATIGPASCSKETIIEMIKAGADVFRLNFSHGTHEEHLKVIETIQEINRENNTHIALLADLQGPKIRLGKIENDEQPIKEDEILTFRTDESSCTGNDIFITYSNFAKDVKAGELIQVDDGKILLEVVDSDYNNTVTVKAKTDGVLKSKKGVNLPNTKISLPCLTPKDLIDLKFALKHHVHWVALSFVRSASDIIELRHIIRENSKFEFAPSIIAKIEKPEALEDIDNIISKADAIMVARGDLGIEIPLQKLPLTQKMLVKKCLSKSTPIIIATQMMEGMIDNYNPTRAEVNDVANSVMDGADALMLSGETSVGKYPVQVIKTMQKVIHEVEVFEDIYHKHDFTLSDGIRGLSDAVIHSSCRLAQKSEASAIVGMTYSGYSALKIISHRPKSNIFIFTENEHLLKKMNLFWGVRGFFFNKFISTDHSMEEILYQLQKDDYVQKDDKVVLLSSTPLLKNAKTNMLKLAIVE